MPGDKSTQPEGLEDLFRKAASLNKEYLAQSVHLMKKLSSRKNINTNLSSVNQDVLISAFTNFSKLNLEYFKNFMEMGFSFVDQILLDSPEKQDSIELPTFTLTGKGEPNGIVKLQFVLENTKDDEVYCTMDNSIFEPEFVQEKEPSINTTFKPQSFTLSPTQTQAIAIQLSIGKDTLPGRYRSKVNVLGFEPTFFDIILTVDEASLKPGNARKKK